MVRSLIFVVLLLPLIPAIGYTLMGNNWPILLPVVFKVPTIPANPNCPK